MRKTQSERRALIDRLEKKYIKKIQLQAFRHESEILKQQLNQMRGRSIRHIYDDEAELLDVPSYKLTYS